jgi:hypothetical protein
MTCAELTAGVAIVTAAIGANVITTTVFAPLIVNLSGLDANCEHTSRPICAQ